MSVMQQEAGKAVAQSKKNYENISEVMQLLGALLPYDKMLLSYDGFLVPLEEKYFRVNSKNISFKYGGEITCVGMVTNIIGSSTNNNADDMFAAVQTMVNQLLMSLLPTKEKDLYIVNPIAVYYGK